LRGQALTNQGELLAAASVGAREIAPKMGNTSVGVGVRAKLRNRDNVVEGRAARMRPDECPTDLSMTDAAAPSVTISDDIAIDGLGFDALHGGPTLLRLSS
jgi:hypothetical protein